MILLLKNCCISGREVKDILIEDGYMTMGYFGMLGFYLKGFYETILAYADARLLSVDQRIWFLLTSILLSNLTFFVAKRRCFLKLSFSLLQNPFDARRTLKKTELAFICSSDFC
jgi:hypothetical protein